MLRSATKIIGHRLSALDGDIGHCTDFLLDDQRWTLRYMVVETGAWLSNRRVLISPLALNKADWTSRRLVLEGTREQVETAPIWHPDTVVSAEHELELSRHYGWSLCGFGGLPGDGPALPAVEPPALTRDPSTLRSVKEMLGYGLQAEDGSVGHVEDFIVDDDEWTMPFLVIDSRNWLSGRKLLLPTEWVSLIDWEERQIHVPLPASKIEDEPEYNPSAPIYGRVEERLMEEYPATGKLAGLSTPRSWSFGPPESWGTRGLRAALARIIHG
jgi:hypothetical protein